MLQITFTYLVLLTVMMILRRFFKVNKSMVFCGIFAFSGKKDLSEEEKKTVLMKFKILGLYNQSRGVHGSGIYINGEVIKSAGSNKLFNDLISNNVFEEMTDDHILIGHCRQMSRGGQTEANTHPFKIKDDLIGVHNGTIENITDLCKTANIIRDYSETDSQALFEIIQQDGIHVLNEYKGGAALIWTRLEEDNVMYVYHGASKTYKLQNEPVVERPLYFLNTEEGIYFSSLENALLAIRNTENDIVFELPTNIVFAIQDGEWLDEDVTIDREEANIPIPIYSNYGTTFPVQTQKETHQFSKQKEIFEGSTSLNRITYDYQKKDELKLEPTIWRETKPSITTKADIKYDFIYFYKGRYHTNVGIVARGKMFVGKGGILYQQENKDCDAYWFFDGIMMKDEKSFDKACELMNMTNSVLYSPNTNFALVVSNLSKYPLTNMVSDAGKIEPNFRFKWYHNGLVAKEGFTPKFSPRFYKISSGVLTEIGSTEKEDDVLFSNFIKASESTIPKDKEIVPFNIDAITESLTKTTSKTANDKIFDVVHPDFDNFLRKIDKVRMMAMMKYVSQERACTHLDMDNEELAVEVSDQILKAVARKITIRVMLEDRYGLLEEFMIDAQKEIDMEEEGAINFQEIDSNPEEKIDADVPYAYYNYDDNDDNDDDTPVGENFEEDIDTLIEEEEKEKESDESNDIMEDVIQLFTEINDKTDQLQALDSCNCAQEFAGVLYKSLTSVKYNLLSVCENEKNEEVANKINNAINI